jgi:CheY-like chemotaxis protein
MDILGKPVDRDALEQAVRRNLRGRASRALVVDDDADSRLLLSSLLETSVEEVRTAADGLQALHLLEEFAPGVILLDLVMPRMDGMAFLKALREHPRHARVPVLVVTSKELSEAETAVLDRVTAGVVRKGGRGPSDVALRDRLATFLDAANPHNGTWN